MQPLMFKSQCKVDELVICTTIVPSDAVDALQPAGRGHQTAFIKLSKDFYTPIQNAAGHF